MPSLKDDKAMQRPLPASSLAVPEAPPLRSDTGGKSISGKTILPASMVGGKTILPSSINTPKSKAKAKDKKTPLESNSAKLSKDKVKKGQNANSSQPKHRFRWERGAKQWIEQQMNQRADENDAEESPNGAGASAKKGGKKGATAAKVQATPKAKTKADAGDDEAAGGNSTRRRKKAPGDPPNPNGRVVGRKLVMWHRPRMMEKLLLHTLYECQREGIVLPWDKIVHRLAPGSSGASALQHLNKIRDIIITEGHLVPPLIGKLGTPGSEGIRGYIRDMDSDIPTDTREVDWEEYIEDRKENLTIPGVVRGSGNYRRKQGDDGANAKSPGARIKKEPGVDEEVMQDVEPVRKVLKSAARRSKAINADEEVDPAELDSEDEYDPKATKKVKYARKPAKKSAIKAEPELGHETDSMSEESEHETDPFVTPTKTMSQSDDSPLMTPPESGVHEAIGESLTVKLCLDSKLLATFPSGASKDHTMHSTFNFVDNPQEISDGEDESGAEEVGESLEESPSAKASRARRAFTDRQANGTVNTLATSFQSNNGSGTNGFVGGMGIGSGIGMQNGYHAPKSENQSSRNSSFHNTPMLPNNALVQQQIFNAYQGFNDMPIVGGSQDLGLSNDMMAGGDDDIVLSSGFMPIGYEGPNVSARLRGYNAVADELAAAGILRPDRPLNNGGMYANNLSSFGGGAGQIGSFGATNYNSMMLSSNARMNHFSNPHGLLALNSFQSSTFNSAHDDDVEELPSSNSSSQISMGHGRSNSAPALVGHDLGKENAAASSPRHTFQNAFLLDTTAEEMVELHMEQEHLMDPEDFVDHGVDHDMDDDFAGIL
ncbi:hypothetical protein G7Y89_g8588 [Cudoniella acicularis]|uniref:Uncharacterized protein n=1 Tax=Cudoniella acicularis TaxID=354080 RepID=A0A8H4RJ40_9HELO|nr:hypothetical protein G7Y89_g8588 [Cudoniella acicularis]